MRIVRFIPTKRIVQVIPAPPGLVTVWASESGPVADQCDLLALVEEKPSEDSDKIEYIFPLIFSNGGEGYMLCDGNDHLGYCERSYFESPIGQSDFKDRYNNYCERNNK